MPINNLTGGTKKKILSVFGVLILLFATGCSTLIRGSSDRLLINSLEQDTVIFVDGGPRGKGSTTVDVKRGQPHDLIAKKDGCQDVAMKTTETFDAVTLLNVFWLQGMLIAFPVDFVSGSAWKQDPTTYTITPICPTKASIPATVTQ